MSNEVEDYVLNKGFEYRKQGDELQLRSCPFCNCDGFHFNINRLMGIWRCVKCDEKGNLFSLKRQLGDLQAPKSVAEAFGDDLAYDVVSREEVGGYIEQLRNDPSTQKYLHDRGFTDEIIERFRLGVSYENTGRWLTIPYWKEGIYVNVKYRSLPPLAKDFRIKAKHEKPLYNCDVLAASGLKEAILVEGELDCISAIVLGKENTISLPMGAGSFSADHWDALVHCERIYLILDPDGAGRAGAQTVAQRLGADRCYNVRIPNGNDINDLLVKYGVDDARVKFDACITESKPFGKGEVASTFEALQELEQHILNRGTVGEGFASPWSSVNEVCGLIGPGEIVLLQAIPKTGKTTFALQWLSWLARIHSVPSLMYCLEMPMWRLMQSLTAETTQVDRDVINTLEVKMTMLRYRNVPLYLGSFPSKWDFEHIRDIVTYCVRRFGVKFLCFDNLQLLCRSTQNLFQEQGAISREFKKLATDNNIAVLLVVQPKKLQPKLVPGMYDPSGSGSFIADADGMITLWRQPLFEESGEGAATIQSESFAPETLVRVPASRYRPGGQTVLHFSGNLATFNELVNER